MIKVIQLPSRHLLKGGKYHLEYKVKVEGVGYFSDLSILWETAVSTTEVNISEDGKIATYLEESDHRAIKYSADELEFIFRDLVVSGLRSQRKTITPLKFQVTQY